MNNESGPPATELTEVEQEVSAEFVNKVRRRIHRRTTANQCLSLTWYLPKVVLVELAGVINHVFGALGGNKDSQR